MLTAMILALAGYLSGSILYCKILPLIFKNTDIIKLSDDKNPGVSNAMKYAGITMGSICLLFELFKGILPVAVAFKIIPPDEMWALFIIPAPVIGHSFPIFEGGKNGGKGVAVSFGVLVSAAFFGEFSVFLLVITYILLHFAIKIKPNEKCTVITFAVLLAFCWLIPGYLGMKIGINILSLIVISRNFHDAFAKSENLEQNDKETVENDKNNESIAAAVTSNKTHIS